jgi:general stress protein CsbA
MFEEIMSSFLPFQMTILLSSRTLNKYIHTILEFLNLKYYFLFFKILLTLEDESQELENRVSIKAKTD